MRAGEELHNSQIQKKGAEAVISLKLSALF
jgi:hypothetical protein